MTVDEQKDLEVVEQLIKAIGVNETWETYTKYMIENELTLINGTILRNEGLLKSLNND